MFFNNKIEKKQHFFKHVKSLDEGILKKFSSQGWRSLEIIEEENKTILAVSCSKLVLIDFDNSRVESIISSENVISDLLYIPSTRDLYGIHSGKLIKVLRKEEKIQYNVTEDNCSSYISSTIELVDDRFLLCIGSPMTKVHFYDYKDQKRVDYKLTFDTACYCVTTFPKKRLIIFGSLRKTHIVRGKPFDEFETHSLICESNILSVNIIESSDWFHGEDLLVLGGNDGTVSMWNRFLEKGREVKIAEVSEVFFRIGANLGDRKGCIYSILIYSDEKFSTYISVCNVFSGVIPTIKGVSVQSKREEGSDEEGSVVMDKMKFQSLAMTRKGSGKKPGFYHGIKWVKNKKFMITASLCGDLSVWRNLKWKEKILDVDQIERSEFIIQNIYQELSFSVKMMDNLSITFPRIIFLM